MPTKENNLELKQSTEDLVVNSSDMVGLQNNTIELPVSENNTVSDESNQEIIAQQENIPLKKGKKVKKIDVELHNVEESDNQNTVVDDEEDDDETKMIDEEESINIDYSSYTKTQLLNAALDGSKMLAPREAIKRIQNIRPFLESILKLEKSEQLHNFISEGNTEENFEYKDDGTKIKFYEAYKLAQEARAEEKKRIEDEKLKNLNSKNAIIERIKELTEIDETVKSIEEVKNLQNEWKTIRAVPKQYLQELYDRYHFYLDKFYDNFAINRELIELDRQKNLVIKIELCSKVESLKNEQSLKKAFILLAKYQEEFKNTGPVPKEANEEIWSRFKNTIDEIYKLKKEQFDKIQEKRTENFKLKELLVEKARIIAIYTPSKSNEWKTNADELNKLMEEWKTIGQVPKSQSESIWHSFREQFNIFSKNRNEYYKKQNHAKKNIINVKEELCKRAEEIMNNENYEETSKEFISLQEEWKRSGHLSEAISNDLWKRFRAACDVFFNKRQEILNQNKSKETENLSIKQNIISEVESLLNNENIDETFVRVKELQEKWNSIGFVPIKNKKKIAEQYHEVIDKIYKKFHKNRENYKQAHLNEHYRDIAKRPDGNKKLGDEERRIREKIGGLKYEISTWENNIGFFTRSKNAEKLKKEIEEKIIKVNEQIEKLKNDLAALKAAKSNT